MWGMSTKYERRITVNFPSVEEAKEVKRRAKVAGVSPSQWIIYQLAAAKELQALWEATKSVKVS